MVLCSHRPNDTIKFIQVRSMFLILIIYSSTIYKYKVYLLLRCMPSMACICFILCSQFTALLNIKQSYYGLQLHKAIMVVVCV